MPTIVSKTKLRAKDCKIKSGHVDLVRIYNNTLYSSEDNEESAESAWKHNTIILEASKGDRIRFNPVFGHDGSIDIHKGVLYLSDYCGKLILPRNVGLEISALESNIIGTITSPANIVTQTGNIRLMIPYNAYLRLCAKTDGVLVIDDEIIYEREGMTGCKKYNGAFEGVKQGLIDAVQRSGIPFIYSFSMGVFYFAKELKHFEPIDICMAYDLVNAQSGTGNVAVSRNRPTKPERTYTLQQVLNSVQKRAFPKTCDLRKREWAAAVEGMYSEAIALRDKARAVEAGKKP